MEAAARALTALALVVALAGCGGSSTPVATPTPDLAGRITGGRCPVTVPGSTVVGDFNYGTRKLAVLLWPKGRLPAGRLPDGSSYAEIRPDGSIRAKLGWWRGVAGRLRIEGQRLDASAPPLRAFIPSGYGATGFQATGLTFPTTGCWRVIGSVGDARLEFVVRVRKLSR